MGNIQKSFLAISVVLGFTLAFQACGQPLRFSSTDQKSLATPNNGEGYFGKPTPYDLISTVQPCAEVGANGKPLPNEEIFVFPNGLAQIVRENCVDITPKPLTAQDYILESSGNLIYQNRIFASNANQGTFDVLAAACPTGRSPLATPVRKSFFLDSLDLMSANWWDTKGTTVSLQGSLGSLPLFQVARLDPAALENWRRLSQNPFVTNGETYVYSFYAKPDPTEKAKFVSYITDASGVNQYLDIEFDLVTGAATVIGTIGAQVVETKAQMFAGGLYINVYFKSLITSQVNMGLGPASSGLGASLWTTSHQFEKVSNFCAP